MAERPTLDNVGVRRRIRIAGLTVLGRRRRPSGEADPLPHELKTSGRAWFLAGLAVVAVWLGLFISTQTSVWWTQRDLDLLRALEAARSDSVTPMMEALHALGSPWAYRILRWATVLALVASKRWRHLFAALGSLLVVHWVVTTMAAQIGRPRPVGIEIIGLWEGWSHPSLPVAALTVTLVVMALSLIPTGRWRVGALWAATGAAALLGFARMYLGADHPSDVVIGYLVGFAVPFVGFRLYAPDAVFPVRWKGGRTAHLVIDARRRRAIRDGVRDQLGLEVTKVEPYALEGSAGSTPLRLTVAGNPPRELFAKLYANTHLRSDRWYKAGRTILYGALEDEVPFSSVRRLVEYEDYMLRYMRDEGIPSAEPFGFVELTAEREYLIVTDFLEGAREIGDATVTAEVAESALRLVRKLWSCGLAHRDVKPSNVMVVGEDVVMIDVAFATIRPSPWRQAVDLANMLLILSTKLPTEEVYEIAQHHFAPADMAEAFAATKGVTIPTQLRNVLRDHRRDTGVDLVELWQEMTPEREPISIQRWSPGRIAATVRVVVIGLVVLTIILDNVSGRGFI